VKLLLDTCTFLWLAADDPQLTPEARAGCRSPDNAAFLSSLSAWEIAIKHRLGRLPLPEPPARYVASRRVWLELEPLPFDEACASHDALLPSHYRRDPFDCVLVERLGDVAVRIDTLAHPRAAWRPERGRSEPG